MNRKPYALIAVAASLLMPGLGQAYAGAPLRGLAWLVGVAILPLFACVAGLWSGRGLAAVVAIGALACLAVYALCARDAWTVARRASTDRALWQRPWVYVLAVVVAYTFVLVPFTGHARDQWIETFIVPSASMAPMILPGDRFLADKRVNRPGGVPLRRGDVAVFVYPDNRTQIFVKRIVALPGDTVDIAGHEIRVNGQSLFKGEVSDLGDGERNALLKDHVAIAEEVDGRRYTVLWKKDGMALQSTFTVPSGQVFVLGDNRDATVDSRRFGPVPLVDVKGTAKQVLFSRGAQVGMRWSRIGKWLD